MLPHVISNDFHFDDGEGSNEVSLNGRKIIRSGLFDLLQGPKK